MLKPFPKYIFISGKKQHGKDTIANMIMEELLKWGLSACKVSYATSLKKACMSIFDLSLLQCNDPTLKEIVDLRWNLTPREILQKFGTEVGRNIHKDVWAISLCNYIKKVSHHYDVFICTDTRFLNEIDIPKITLDPAPYFIRIIRPNMEKTDFDNHPSETELDNYSNWNNVIVNSKDLEYLELKIKEFVNLFSIESFSFKQKISHYPD